MNLIGRLFLEAFSMLFRTAVFDPLKPIVRHYRVWPHDMDLNIHLTASRYFSLADLSRIAWMAENKFLKAFVTRQFFGVVNAQEITYIREFKPFAKLRMESQLISWDMKYAYFEQRFYCGDKLHAVAHVRMAILYQGKVISIGDVFSKLGHDIESPTETVVIADWKEMLNAKRDQFSNNAPAPK